MDQDENLEVETSDSEIQEGEIVSGQPSVTSQQDQGQTIIENLKGLIKENLAREKKLKEEVKNAKEMIDSELARDETYKQHDEAAKLAAKTKNATKQEILKRPNVSTINQKVKDINTELKEMKESMTSYLQEYQRLSGSNEIEDDEGGVRQIVYKAILVRRKP